MIQLSNIGPPGRMRFARGSNPVIPRHQLRRSSAGTEPSAWRHAQRRAAADAMRRDAVLVLRPHVGEHLVALGDRDQACGRWRRQAWGGLWRVDGTDEAECPGARFYIVEKLRDAVARLDGSSPLMRCCTVVRRLHAKERITHHDESQGLLENRTCRRGVP